MKNLKHSLFYGGLSGLAMCTSWVVMNLFFVKDGKIDFDGSEIGGYTAMILSLTAVFIGVKNYRDRELKGLITFGKAFFVGLNIVLVASVVYVVSWCIYYPNFMPDFPTQYMDCQIQKFQESGLSSAEISTKTTELKDWMVLYENPLYMIGMTFMEIFPVGLVVALLTALILKRKTPKASES